MARRYRGFVRRYYGRARRYGSKVGLNVNMPFLAGAVIGFSDLDEKIPAQIVLGAATVPVRGLGTVKAAAQGIIFGNLLQQLKNKQVSTEGYQSVVTI
jgi:hypothetical protein